MSDFILAHVDSLGGLKPPTNLVAVAIGQSGKYSWSDFTIMGHDCVTHEEWDSMVDRLIKSLEQVRRRGHAKLKENDDT
jgi:hypothetical protein